MQKQPTFLQFFGSAQQSATQLLFLTFSPSITSHNYAGGVRVPGGKRKWHNQAKLIVATFAMLKHEFMLQNKLKMQIANAHHPHFAGSAVEGALQSQ